MQDTKDKELTKFKSEYENLINKNEEYAIRVNGMLTKFEEMQDKINKSEQEFKTKEDEFKSKND